MQFYVKFRKPILWPPLVKLRASIDNKIINK